MKLSFSTLGCPGWDLNKVLECAVKYGYDGVDLRGLSGVMRTEDIPELQPSAINSTREAFAKSGKTLTCIGTSCSFHDPAKYHGAIEEGKNALGICAKLGVPFIRVFGNNIKSEDGRAESDAVIAGIRELCAYADSLTEEYLMNADDAVKTEYNRIYVLLEVHGDFNTSRVLLPICRALEGECFGIIWDFAHSERAGEDYREFWRELKPYILHTHVKDHKREQNGGRKLCSVGDGDIPIIPTAELMLGDGYNGYFTLEHELAWHPELAPAEEELPRYTDYMKRIGK
ncbi:MAG: sugar phosphate isomerase/epimerase [Clostridia bacterium]|nr:sugar phosphate isomerase/epimerase [Clostridia bacterium]